MSKLLTVAQQEIRFHLSQRSFYITLIAMPLVFAALGALPRLQNAVERAPLPPVETVLNLGSETLTAPVGIVDHAGLIQDFDQFQPFESVDAADEALRRETIESYYVIATNYLESRQVVEYSQDPQLLSEHDAAVRALLRDNLLQSLDNPNLAARLAHPVEWERQGPPPPVARFIPADMDLSRLVSAGLVIGLFIYLINAGGHLLLRALQREVKAHVLEVMMVSTTPEQFIGGKLVGLTVLTVLQAGLALTAAALVYGQNPDGSGPAALPIVLLALSVPYLLLGFLTTCALLMGIAVLWPNFKESTLLLAAFRFVSLIPLIGTLFILPNPGGPIAMALTLLPITSHLLMPFHLLVEAVPLWQWGLGLVLLTLWTIACLWFSMRLFRLNGLLTGRNVSPNLIWQAMWR
ncbi:MAG: ABC transporter permease [Anaerolineae bacterium]|nr:ABC transporter permease [Anaerolineae bacterium]